MAALFVCACLCARACVYVCFPSLSFQPTKGDSWCKAWLPKSWGGGVWLYGKLIHTLTHITHTSLHTNTLPHTVMRRALAGMEGRQAHCNYRRCLGVGDGWLSHIHAHTRTHKHNDVCWETQRGREKEQWKKEWGTDERGNRGMCLGWRRTVQSHTSSFPFYCLYVQMCQLMVYSRKTK